MKSPAINAATEAALAYLGQGLTPIPIPQGKKGPTLANWGQLSPKLEEIPELFASSGNVGLLLGAPSGFLIDIDLDAPEAVNIAREFLLPTGRIQGRQSKPESHYFYRGRGPLPGTKKFSDVDGTCIAEFRTDNSQTVVPPSTHPSGERIIWYSEGEFTIVDSEEILRRTSIVAACVLLIRHWPSEGQRHAASLAVAGVLSSADWTEQQVERFIRIVVTHAHDEELADRVRCVTTTTNRLQAGKPVSGLRAFAEVFGSSVTRRFREWLGLEQKKRECNLTDLGNAKRLVSRHAEDIRFCHSIGKWFIWDGSRWALDDTGEIHRRAKDTVRSIYGEATRESDDNKRRSIAAWGQRSEARAHLRNMEELAQSEEQVIVRTDELDSDPLLFNCKNGTLDLKTGTFQEHSREDMCTKVAPVEFLPDATCPTWERFLAEITGQDSELSKYIQTIVGYALTGDVSENVLFLLNGTGANGKSTFIEVIRTILGDYGQTADPSLLLERARDNVPNDVARLIGVRFVAAVETGSDRKFAVTLVKQLTGGDTITARFLHKEFFEFQPQFKLFLATNHLPVIKDGEIAIWRRVRVIPFDVSIPPEKQDKKLLTKLKSELPGILNWAVKGTLDWIEHGLNTPLAVEKATSEYRSEMDRLGDFLHECCALGPDKKATAGLLYDSYRNWCSRNGENPCTQHEFGRYLGQQGLTKYRGGQGVRMWRGIGVLEAPF